MNREEWQPLEGAPWLRWRCVDGIVTFGPAQPAAPDATAGDGLRERAALAIWNEGGWCGECDHRDFDECSMCRDDCTRYADAAIRALDVP